MVSDTQYQVKDGQGLKEAYSSPDFTAIHDTTMYIAGTDGPATAITSWWKIPVNIKWSERYKQAANRLRLNPQVKTLVGHSLGGAVAARIIEDNINLHGRVYGAPLLRVNQHQRLQSFRHWGDPVSVLDRSSNMSLHLGNTHEYQDYHNPY